MKLTRAASYALHAVAFMASQKTQDRPIASHNIAAAVEDMPKRFLLKVLKPLVDHNVLKSIKGPNGGYRLARSPSDISVLEILEAIDGPIQGQASFTDENNGALNAKLNAICRGAADQTRKHLQRIRLSELANGSRKH
jgi:Rrf2 family protein